MLVATGLLPHKYVRVWTRPGNVARVSRLHAAWPRLMPAESDWAEIRITHRMMRPKLPDRLCQSPARASRACREACVACGRVLAGVVSTGEWNMGWITALGLARRGPCPLLPAPLPPVRRPARTCTRACSWPLTPLQSLTIGAFAVVPGFGACAYQVHASRRIVAGNDTRCGVAVCR